MRTYRSSASGGCWWIFSCTPPGRHETLRLYRADSLTGPWTEHPRSPLIERNPHIARPAGRVVAEDGRLLRFTQDRYPHYGRQVWAFRITILMPEDYREEPAGPAPVLGPEPRGWNRGGMHHVDAQLWTRGGWIAAVDGWA